VYYRIYKISIFGSNLVFRFIEESTEICRCATLSLDEPLAAGAETIFGAGL
jgi:hypothetical protein